MRNVRMTIMMMVILLNSSQVMGWTQYNDGGTYDIATTINDDIWVDWESPGMGTNVNFILGGNVTGQLKSFQDSKINVNGGDLTCELLNAFGRSHISLSNGSIRTGGNLKLYDNSQMDITGGSIFNSILQVYNDSYVSFSNGSINNSISGKDTSHIVVYSGTVGSSLSGTEHCQIDMYGGNVNGYLTATDNTQINLFGGVINNSFRVSNTARITIYGTDFAIDGVPVNYGELQSILGSSYSSEPSRHITGMLSNGGLLDNDFYIGYEGSITLIPEPSTIFLLIGAIPFIRRYKK